MAEKQIDINRDLSNMEKEWDAKNASRPPIKFNFEAAMLAEQGRQVGTRDPRKTSR